MSSLLERLRTALAPQYEVERELASGGMGTVFLARDPNLDRPVAIKILRPDLASDTASDRFLREARILARLSHHNVVPVHQAGEADGLSYYVMEYVEGATLKERLERGAMPKEQALKLANDLLSALEEAHRHGIVHRDVKPSNIFLVGDRALLGDFGIAKPSEDSSERLTASGQRIGTPGYMAPEQLLSEEVTPATDIYAAGMVIYEALTGRPVPPRADEADWSGMPSELVAPLRRALEWAPEERWQDALSFRNALARSQHSAAKRRVVIAAATSVAALVLGAGWFALKGTVGPSAQKSSPMPTLGPSAQKSSPMPTLDPHRVAVLYFDVLSGSEEYRYVADGLTEALIDELWQVRDLDVISKNGVLRYRGQDISRKAMADDLGAGTIVDGNIGEDGDQFRVTVRIADGNTGTDSLWRTFTVLKSRLLVARSQAIITAAQLLSDYLATRIEVPSVASANQRVAQTSSSEAWAYYLQGEEAQKDGLSLTERGDSAAASAAYQRADSLFAVANSVDPNWIDPIIGRMLVAYRSSRVVYPVYGIGDAKSAIERGLRFGEQALEMDPDNAEALEYRGTLRYFSLLIHVETDSVKHDVLVREAQRDLERAIQLDPARASAWSTLSHLNYRLDDVVGALLAARRAYEEDPYYPIAASVIGRLVFASYDLAQFAQARLWCREGALRFPDNFRFVECQLFLMATPGAETDIGLAWELLEWQYALSPDSLVEFYQLSGQIFVAAAIGRAGLPDSARNVLARVSAQITPEIDPDDELKIIEAFARAQIGDEDAAIELLKDYAERHYDFTSGDYLHWWWQDLSQHPRWHEVREASQ